MKISIVIPVYNESENINDLYNKIKSVIRILDYEFEIIFIDDGSSDDTIKILKEIKESDINVKIISFKRNFGQTAALAAGIEHSSGDVIITMDGDGQNDPESIPDLLNAINSGYDLAVGWRRHRQDNFWFRRLPSIIANKIISFATRTKFHDHGCTMKAFKREAVSDVSLYGELHRFITVLLCWSGAKSIEIPVKHNPRVHGKSKYGIMRTFKVMLDLFTLIFLRSYATKPIYVFGGAGIFCIAMSFFTIAIALYQKYYGHYHLTLINNPLLHLSALLLIL